MKQWENIYILHNKSTASQKSIFIFCFLSLTSQQTWESQLFHVSNFFTTIEIIQPPFSYLLHLIYQCLTGKKARWNYIFLIQTILDSGHNSYDIQAFLSIHFNNLCQGWNQSKLNLARIYVVDVCEPLLEDKARRHIFKSKVFFLKHFL